MPICRTFYGSDGTRTRDLRRDRPSQAPRRRATNLSKRVTVQSLGLGEGGERVAAGVGGEKVGEVGEERLFL